jgi:predicted ester cyclase
MGLAMTKEDLRDRYHGYIDCLNRQDWRHLADHVADEVQRNGEALGLVGYRTMLEGDFAAIPDLFFKIDFLVSEPPMSERGSSSIARRKANCSGFPSTAGGSRLPKMYSIGSPTGRLKPSGR